VRVSSVYRRSVSGMFFIFFGGFLSYKHLELATAVTHPPYLGGSCGRKMPLLPRLKGLVFGRAAVAEWCLRGTHERSARILAIDF
jgi:hypothetical protein